MRTPALASRLGAEFLGTFWLVLGGCGSAIFAARFLADDKDTGLGIGFVGVALAFGLTVLTMAYAVGHISGGHFNPAITVGLFAGGRFAAKDVIPYVIAQVIGGIAAAAVLYLIASGKAGFDATAGGFASNGYGEHSPGGYSLQSAIVIELVLTAFFLIVIHGVTDKRAPAGFAPLAIGLTLSWGIYAYCKRSLPLPANEGFTVEVLILSLPVIFYSAWIFFDGAYRALRAKTLDMMVLVAVGVGQKPDDKPAWTGGQVEGWISQEPDHRSLIARRLQDMGLILSICTNKPEGLAETLTRQLGIRDMFGALVGADTLPVRKPDPAPYAAAVERAGGTVARSMLVGDTDTDRQTARAAGVPVALVTFGPEGHGVDRFAPEALLHDYADLPGMAVRLIG